MATAPLHDIAHLGHVELFTPAPERSLWYFRDVLGMSVVHEAGVSVFLRAWGDHAMSTLKLTEASHNGVGTIAWRAMSPAALDRRAAAIEAAGLGIGWSNGDFGRGRSYRFRDPDGHTMEIYYEEQRYEAPDDQRSHLKNQPQRFSGNGVGVRRTDHLALLAADVGLVPARGATVSVRVARASRRACAVRKTAVRALGGVPECGAVAILIGRQLDLKPVFRGIPKDLRHLRQDLGRSITLAEASQAHTGFKTEPGIQNSQTEHALQSGVRGPGPPRFELGHGLQKASIAGHLR